MTHQPSILSTTLHVSLVLAAWCLPLGAQVDSFKIPTPGLAPKGELRPTITGFASVSWGAPEDSVTAVYGMPGDSHTEFEGKMLAYEDQVLDEDVVMAFLVHDSLGMIHGSYTIEYGMGSNCEVVFRKFSEAIRQRYPVFTPDETKHNNSSLDFCGGIAIGKAQWMIVWSDPSLLVRVGVVLEPESRVVSVSYEGPGFSEYLQRRAAAERRTRF